MIISTIFRIISFIPSKKPNPQKKDDNLIIYVGEITKIRGFNEIIEALFLIEERYSFKFMVIEAPAPSLRYHLTS